MNTQPLLNATHDAKARSWLSSANAPGTDFPIQNLPFAIFRRDEAENFRGGVAIGDAIVDLAALDKMGIFQAQAAAGLRAATQPSLNALMQLGPAASSALRHSLFEALS